MVEAVTAADRAKTAADRTRAVFYFIAAGIFLLTALLGGGVGANSAFVILAMVFTVLAMNAWHSKPTEVEDVHRIESEAVRDAPIGPDEAG